jgi:hypothetical protein
MNNLYKTLLFGLVVKTINFFRSGIFPILLILAQIVLVVLKLATAAITASWWIVLLPIILYVGFLLCFFAFVGYKFLGGYKAM